MTATSDAVTSLPNTPAPRSARVSVVIPNYNGVTTGVLEPCLRSLAAATAGDPAVRETIVVDDASTDGSAALVRERFPGVRLLEHPANRGFLAAANTGLRAATGDFIFLGNSDLVFTADFLAPILDCFRDPAVALASPRLVEADGKTFQSGVNLGTIRDGHISIWNESQTALIPAAGAPLPTLYAIGAALLVRADRLRSLGYFDPLFRPSNWEDIDLGYRARQAGWRVVYQPASVLVHHHHASIRTVYSRERSATLAARNEYLFFWKNIGDADYWWRHLRQLPGRLWGQYRRGDRAALRGFAAALARLPEVARSRWRTVRTRSDRELFAGVTEPYLARVSAAGSSRRVLFITQEYPDRPDTGGKNRNRELLRRLGREFELHLVAFSEHDLLPGAALDGCRSVTAVKRRYDLAPFDKPGLPATIRDTTEAGMVAAVARLVGELDPEIIVGDSLMASAYVRAYAGVRPTVYIEHDTGMIDPLRSYLWQRRQAFAPRWWLESARLLAYEADLCRRVTEVVALTAEDRDYLRGLGVRGPIALAPTAVDWDRFNPAPDRVPRPLPDLVFVGYFGHHPNVEGIRWFHRAVWPRLRRRFPGLRLRVVGSAPGPDVRALAAADPYVTVTGYVPELKTELDRDAIFIAPLRLGGGIRGKLLEAMALALPVVATPAAVSGLDPAVVAAIGVGGTAGALAAHIAELVADPAMRRELGARGRDLVRRQYDWDETARVLALVIRRADARFHNFPRRDL